MTAIFLGCKVPTIIGFSDYEEPAPGLSHYPGNWREEAEAKQYAYPWGTKHRSIFFRGPHRKEDMNLGEH